MASFSQGILHYGKFVANVIFPKMDLIGNQITKVPIHNHYKRICNQIPIKKVKDFGFFQSLNQILPHYADVYIGILLSDPPFLQKSRI